MENAFANPQCSIEDAKMKSYVESNTYEPYDESSNRSSAVLRRRPNRSTRAFVIERKFRRHQLIAVNRAGTLLASSRRHSHGESDEKATRTAQIQISQKGYFNNYDHQALCRIAAASRIAPSGNYSSSIRQSHEKVGALSWLIQLGS